MMTILALLLAAVLCQTAWGGELLHTVNFDPRGLSFSRYGEYDRMELAGALAYGPEGAPRLPRMVLALAVPAGAEVTGVEVVSADESELEGVYRVIPSQRAVPLPMPGKAFSTGKPEPDRAIYNKNAPYPETWASALSTGSLCGYRIGHVAVNPVRWNPSTGKLVFARSLTLRVRYDEGRGGATVPTKGQHEAFGAQAKRLVANPQDVDFFAPRVFRAPSKALPAGEYRAVIISGSASFDTVFARLAAWHTRKGYRDTVVNVSYITANYSGYDNTERIRNFIIDAAGTWGTMFVLLAGQGDDLNSGQNLVPARHAYYVNSGVGAYPDENQIPSDLYYADLDGTWDADGDHTYGELEDNVNMYSDVFVGRAPVLNVAQAQNFVAKTMGYEKNNPGTQIRKMLLPSAILWSSYEERPTQRAIAAMTPAGWLDDSLFERNGTLSQAAMVASMNDGRGLGHWIGHGDENGIYMGSAYYTSSNAQAASNGDKQGIHTSIACFTGAFDEVSGGDCLAEHIINRAGGGAVGVHMNSRYGWGAIAGGVYVMGPSEMIDTTFMCNILKRGFAAQGQVLAMAKNSWVPYADSSNQYDMMRWCLYELNLFGDPALPILTEDPRTLAVAHSAIVPSGPSDYEVTVTDQATSSPVSGALICLMTKCGDSYVYGTTGSGGAVTLHPSPMVGNDTMWVTATARNYDPYEGHAIVSADCPVPPVSQKLFHCARVPDTRPTLTFTSTDPQGDAIQYRVLWDTLPGFPAPDSAATITYASGAQASFTFPYDLLSGRVYWWKAKGTDPSGSGKWGPYGPARCFAVESAMPSSSCSWYQARAAQFAEDVRSGLVLSGDTLGLATTQVTDTMLYRDFEGSGLPSGWSAVQNQTPADAYSWTVGTCSDLSTYLPPSAGASYAYYNDDDAGSSNPATIEDLVAPPVGLPAGTANLSLAYGYGYRDYSSASESLYVQVRFAPGGAWGAWTTKKIYKGSSSSGTETVDLSAHLPADSMQSRWRYDDGNGGWGYGGAVDNVVVSGTHDALVGSGALTALPVAYADLAATYPRANWGYIHCRKRAAADSVGVQVQYQNGGAWALIPNAQLAGNSTGFYSQTEYVTVNLTGLNTGTYDTVRVAGTLLSGSSKASPAPGLVSIETGSTDANPLAVHLASFTAEALPGKVRLAWRTESETECYQWEIGRSPQPGGEYAVIGNLEGHGTTVEPQEYEFTDQAPGFGTLYYRLAEVGLSGARTYYGPMAVCLSPLDIFTYRLNRPFPNPGPGRFSVSYSLAKAGHTVLAVYNILGQEVRRLVDGPQSPDRYRVDWDGRDSRGRQAAGGVYFVKLVSGDFNSMARAMLLR